MPDPDELLAAAKKPAADALRLHPFYRGKIQMAPKCPIRDLGDFAIWYTPGVAAPCREIQQHPERVFEHTNKANSVAIVSDGSRVLGLGDIGPEAGLPVMEGKALLFKYLGGVDAVPLCVRTADPDELVRTVKALEPSFGGVNLEDIAQPGCFRVLETLRSELEIPVWHDDQQGTATVVLAALANALEVVGKPLGSVRIALVGMGAANVPTYRLLQQRGVDPRAIVACDSRGTLHAERRDVEERRTEFADKWRVCRESNGDRVVGDVGAALRGADVCIAFSTRGVIRPEWIAAMADDAIVFACANPEPEIWPWEAKQAGARIVATGRSDFPNQVNNSMGFPGIFRGTLDVRARSISDEMALAAADELARFAAKRGIDEDHLVPGMDEWQVFVHEAVATALQAQQQGLAKLDLGAAELEAAATQRIQDARAHAELLVREGLVRLPPEA